MKRQHNWTLVTTLALGMFAIGCGGGDGKVDNPSGKLDSSGNQVSQEAANKFSAALAAMNKHDDANDWTPATCSAVGGQFEAAAAEQSDAAGAYFKEAMYNAAMAYQRCNLTEKAQPIFEEILEKDPANDRARVHVALYQYAANGNVDAAISQMEKAVSDSKFQNVEALVNLAMLQMQRRNNVSDNDGSNDFDRAKKNLQRALAIQDDFMPAFNQLAIYYLETAKQKAGKGSFEFTQGAGDSEQADTQALELAALVASQAVRKNAKYAPIHNTAGLIEVQLENLNSAVRSFDTARKLDPGFFEAHMNYASVNMKFRGFQNAQQAYEAALKIRPKSYDARLGMALAIRGQIDLGNQQQMVPKVEEQLAQAKQIAPERPEAYYNEAILWLEFKAKSDKPEAALKKSKELFQTFVSKAGSKDVYAAAVQDVTARPTKSDQQCLSAGSANDPGCKIGRLMEIDDQIAFLKESAEMQAQMEEEMKQRQALQDAEALTGGEEE